MTDNMSTTPHNEKSSRGIRAELTTRVRKGVWTKGGMIPSRRALAKEFNVSVPTVHKAISDMIADGILRVDANRTFVYDDPDPPTDAPTAPGFDATRRAPNAVATATVMIIADIRPNHDRLFDSRRVVMVDEAEHALSDAGIQPRFINRYGVEQRMHDPSSGVSPQDNPAIAPTLAGLVIADAPNAVITFDTETATRTSVFLSRLARHDIPVVVAGAVNLPIAGCVTVTYDDVDGGFQAGSHLIKLGCRRLLFFAPYQSQWVRGRLEGMRQACQRHTSNGVSLVEHIEDSDITDLRRATKYTLVQSELGYEIAARLLATGIFVDGVVTANDDVAAGYIQAAADRGLKVGREFLMVGFDDSSQSRDLGLSSMHPPVAMLGREAALAAERMVNNQNLYSSIAIKFRLVARASSSFAAD